MHASARGASPGRGGFTLIELLVVVAIVALLISILLPSLAQARKQGRAAVCLSNMRQLMLAVQLYEQSHGVFPSAGLAHGGAGDDEPRTWVTQLVAEYGHQQDAIRCRDDLSPHWRAPVPGGPRLRRTSYASTSYVAYPLSGRLLYNRYDGIRYPASTVFWTELAEEGEYAAADHVHPENWWFGDGRELASRELQLARHLGRANYALVDGHAEPYPFEKTYLIDPDGGFPPQFIHNKYDPAIAR